MLYTLWTQKKYLSRDATSILKEVPCCLTEFNEDGRDENELGRLYIVIFTSSEKIVRYFFQIQVQHRQIMEGTHGIQFLT